MESNSSQEVRWFLGVLMWKAQTASSFPEFQDYLAKLRHPIGESGDLFGPLDKSRVEALFDFYCEKQRSFGVSVDESAGAEFSQSLRASRTAKLARLQHCQTLLTLVVPL